MLRHYIKYQIDIESLGKFYDCRVNTATGFADLIESLPKFPFWDIRIKDTFIETIEANKEWLQVI